MLLLLPRMLDCRGAPARTTTRPCPLAWTGGTLPLIRTRRLGQTEQRHHACRCEPDPEGPGTARPTLPHGIGPQAQRACPQHLAGPCRAPQALCSTPRPSPER